MLVDVTRVLDAESPDVLSAVSSPSPWDPPGPISRQLPEKSGNSSWNIQMYSPITVFQPKRRVFHDLPTIPGPSVIAKVYRLDLGKLASTQAEVDFLKMEKVGIVRRTSSPWSSPLHMVP